MGHVITHRAILTFPLKGKGGMGHVITHRAILTFPFKGKGGMGMGQNLWRAKFQPIPLLGAPSPLRLLSPLKGEEFRPHCAAVISAAYSETLH